MRFHEGHIYVDSRDVCDKCEYCYICDKQFYLQDKLEGIDNELEICYTIDSCLSFIPLKSNRPNGGTINDLIKWRKGD